MSASEAVSLSTLAGILACAASTYLMRIGGFWLMGRVTITARVRRMLEALPGAVVVAVVLPILAKNGIPGAAGIAAAIATMLILRSEFLAVIVGVGAVALARAAGL